MPGPVPYSDIGGGGALPPHGEDYFNRIVNVHWPKKRIVQPQQWLLGIFRNNNTALGNPVKAVSQNGQTYGGMSAGASIAGYTVISAGCVAAGQFFNEDGTPKNGGECFMVSNGSSVQIGIVKADGINWGGGWSSPDGKILAISYANGGFFVSYRNSDNTSSLAVSFDGENFSSGIFPFAGLDFAYPGGGVAYVNGVYATASAVFVLDDRYSSTKHGYQMFAWATSSDGFGWSAGNSSLEEGILGDYRPFVQTNICAGDGVFGAAGAKGNISTAGPSESGPSDPYYVPSCAVVESSDGASWAADELPGADWRGSYEKGDRGGTTSAVAFVNGVFVAAGNESGGSEGGAFEPTTSKLWVGGSIAMQEDSDWDTGIYYGAVSSIDANPQKVVFA